MDHNEPDDDELGGPADSDADDFTERRYGAGPDREVDDAYSAFAGGAVDDLFDQWATRDRENAMRSVLGDAARHTAPRGSGSGSDMSMSESQALAAERAAANEAHEREARLAGGDRRRLYDDLDEFVELEPAPLDEPTAKIEDRLRTALPDEEEYRRLADQAWVRSRGGR